MKRRTNARATVAVVDPDRDYQDAISALMAANEATFRFYGSGREALRLGAVDHGALWLISVELPDMTGLDLLEMLRDRLDGAAVCMVGKTYRVEDEMGAYRAGAAMYACKPIDASWLRACIRRRDRAGPSEVGPTTFAPSAARLA
jgi:DNA-binding response OmpR family regulator